jgi:mutator protein MutT
MPDDDKNNSEAKDFINLGVVRNEAGEILMVRRLNPEKGKNESTLGWAFPGGKQRFKESREQCVKREVLDETGYDIVPTRQLSLRMHPQFPVMIVYHLCELASQKPVAEPKEPHEIAEVKWVKSGEVKNLITSDLDPNVSRELGLKNK